MHFYPRSPCGERLASLLAAGGSRYFYPRSPCGERHQIREDTSGATKHFYPRSPCGERHRYGRPVDVQFVFLSTLSLRRATGKVKVVEPGLAFLSTLSLRRATRRSVKLFRQNYISIHALLAESDFIFMLLLALISLFLSTLSLRRATHGLHLNWPECLFLSTLSLRRATREPTALRTPHHRFLSTLSLRRATAAGRFLLS